MTDKKTPFTPRTEITVLGPDDPDKERLGYEMRIIPIGMTSREYWKETLSKEAFAEWERSVDPQQNQYTDRADKYLGCFGYDFEEDTGTCLTNIPVLEFLWGQPWNNLALNFVSTLRPSRLRVTSSGVTLDCCNWRVTVWLEKDNRTIRNIEQSVSMHGEGALNAQDIEMQLKYQKEHGNLEEYVYPEGNGICFLNDEAIKLEVEDKDGE